jgi:5-methyltetrahydrofolate--homocysteine methyltransferase
VRLAALPAGRRVLDGAMGTALIAAGLPAGVPPETWVLERPDAVAAVHRAHAAAGARLLLTCTFNAASGRVAARLGPGGVAGACAAAVALARAEAGPQGAPGCLVAGAVGPLAVAVPGGDAPPAAALEAPFRTPLRALAEAGADLLWLESQYDGREAAAALAAALPLGLPVVVTFTLAERGGRLLTAAGGPAEPLLLAAAAAGAAAVGVNCVPAGAPLAALAAWAHGALPAPFVAKPSPGLPGAVLAPADFAAAVAPALRAGAGWLGGCCGAGAGHVAALAALLAGQAGAPRG